MIVMIITGLPCQLNFAGLCGGLRNVSQFKHQISDYEATKSRFDIPVSAKICAFSEFFIKSLQSKTYFGQRFIVPFQEKIRVI